MKYCKRVLYAFVLISVFGFINCKGDVESSNSGDGLSIDCEAGDVALEKIKIGETEYDFTTEVYVTNGDGATIEGKENIGNYAGAFVKKRKVKLSPYIMSKYEITQELYTAVMTGQFVIINGEKQFLSAKPFECTADNNDYKILLEGEKQQYRAAEGMTWYDAVYFCNVLSEKTNLTKAYNITVTNVNSNGNITGATVTLVSGANGYRLPTEAEWEFSARGGDPAAPAWDYTFSGVAKAEYSNYDDVSNIALDTVAWYRKNMGGITNQNIDWPETGTAGYGTHQVGKRNYNDLGIYDMSGNVQEWCYDLFNYSVIQNDNEYIKNGIVINPSGASIGSRSTTRVVRGGAWTSLADDCCVCCREDCIAEDTRDDTGFRVVRNAQ